MSQTQPPSLDALIERFTSEISEHAAQERARVTAAADAAINGSTSLRPHWARSCPGVPSLGPVRRAGRRRGAARAAPLERGLEPGTAKDVPGRTLDGA